MTRPEGIYLHVVNYFDAAPDNFPEKGFQEDSHQDDFLGEIMIMIFAAAADDSEEENYFQQENYFDRHLKICSPLAGHCGRAAVQSDYGGRLLMLAGKEVDRCYIYSWMLQRLQR